jgi:hypothetical protein
MTSTSQGNGIRRLVSLLAALAIATVAACNPNASAPELTDPGEILGRTVASTAGLRSMRVRADLEVRDQNQPGVVQGGAAEGVFDNGTGEMSLTGAARDGTGAFALISADGATFVNSSGNGRWTKMPAMGGGLVAMFLTGQGGAQQADIRLVLADLLDDPETTLELRGVEDCATGRCYVTTVALPPAQVWKLVVGLTGIDRLQGAGQVMEQPQGIPPVALQVVTDTATLRLVELAASVGYDSTSVAVRVRVASPNEPVAIEAPPPAIVDDASNTNGGFGIGGGGVAPGPAPVQPVPAESIGP